MARKKKDEEEVVEEGAVEEEAAPAGAEFVPERAHKPKSDVYTLVLILTFIAFLTGSIIAGREAWEHYDVQFWMFEKPKGRAAEPAATLEPEPAAAPAAPQNP